MLLGYFFEHLDPDLLDFLGEHPSSCSPYHKAMFSSASAGLIRCWAKRNFQETPEELLAFFLKNMWK